MIGNFFIQFFIPLFFALGFYLPTTNFDEKKCQIWSIVGSLLYFASTLNFVLFHGYISSPVQLYSNKMDNVFNISYTLSLDPFGSIFLLTNSLLLLITILSTLKGEIKKIKLYYFLIFFSCWIANAAMYASNLYSYYLFWEFLFIPLFILIGATGKKIEKNTSYKTLIYFSISSILMLGVTIYMGNAAFLNYGSFDLTSQIIRNLIVDSENFASVKTTVFWIFTLAILIRMPVFLFHNWLPDFGEKSPTTSTVISMAFLVNISIYGLIKFIIPTFVDTLSNYNYIFMAIGTIGMIYFPLKAMRQTKIKTLLIYSYLTHVSLTMIGIFTLNHSATSAAIYHIICNILAISGLFCLIYNLEKNKFNGSIVELKKYLKKVSIYSLFFFMFLIIFMPLPPTAGLPSLLVIITKIYQSSKIIGILCVTGISLNIICLITAFFSNHNEKSITTEKIYKMDRVEMIPITMISIFFIISTLFPHTIMKHIGNY